YKIRITSIDHVTLMDTSDNAFSIRKATTGVSDSKISNTTYRLCQNYPNPFNPTTTISYLIPEQSNVELKVYNMLGCEVTTLVSKMQNAGEYRLHFDGSNLPSGIYIYTIRAGQYRASKKFILLK
ncbi:MAG: T9SS type A sorting domain-containing protein, partial [Syntrophomonadaceae bacterium]